MAKRNAAIEATLTRPGITRPVGRPRKPDALTSAQRQAAYRARRRCQDPVLPTVTEIRDLELLSLCTEIRRQSLIPNMVWPAVFFSDLLKLVSFVEQNLSVTRNGN